MTKAEFQPLDRQIRNAFERVYDLNEEIERFVVRHQATHADFSADARFRERHLSYSSRVANEIGGGLSGLGGSAGIKAQILELDLRTPSTVTAFELDQVLSDSRLAGLGAAFVQAELDHGVNALFLASLAIHESDWGSSRIARDKNNLFGFGAYDQSPYASSFRFSTMAEGIDRVASYLSINYLREDGRHFSGGFSVRHLNRRYASDKAWGNKVANIMYLVDQEILGINTIVAGEGGESF